MATKQFKVCTVDIETSALEAVGAGFIVCAVIKPLGDKPIVFRYDDYDCSPGREAKMLKALVKGLEVYDMWVGHNIERFDYNYIKTRSLVLGVPLSTRPLLYDTLKAFRRCGFLSRPNGFGKPTAGLAMVVDLLGLENIKTAIYPEEHWKTVWETDRSKRKEAINNLVDHCVKDVKMTEDVFSALFDRDTNFTLRRVK